MTRLWNPPDLSPGASDGAALVERCMPDQDRTFVLTGADLGIEILTKAGRANAFPLSDPWEDSWVADTFIDELADSVEGLRAGDLLLFDASATKTYDVYLEDPTRDPLIEPVGGNFSRIDVAALEFGANKQRKQRADPQGIVHQFLQPAL